MFDKTWPVSVPIATTSIVIGGCSGRNLSDLERDFIDRRMADEQAALDALVAETFPVTFPLPKDSSSTSSSMVAAP